MPWQYSCLLSINGQCPSWHFSGPEEISRCPHLAPFLMHHTALQGHHAVFSSHHCPCHQHLRSRSEEHTSELQSLRHLVCRLLLEKKKKCSRRAFAVSVRHWTCSIDCLLLIYSK